MRTKGDDLMRMLKHDHIAEYYGYFFDEKNQLYFVMKFYDGGNLENYLEELKKKNLSVAEDHIVKWSQQLVDAINYSTGRGIIHNDLKPANILLNKDKSSIVVTDFGMAVAKDMKKSHGYIMGGTPLYLAPEAFEKDGKIYPKSDLWSCGVIIYQLIHQSLPFNSLKEIVSTNFQHTCAQSNVCNKFSPLLKKIFQTDIDQRPTFSDAISFLEKLNKPNLQDDSISAPVRPQTASNKNQISLVEDSLENRILLFSALVDSSSVDVDLIIDYLKNNDQIKVNEEITKRKCNELAQSGLVELKIENRTKLVLKMNVKTKEMILTQLTILSKAKKEEEKILEYFDRITPSIDDNPDEDWETIKSLQNHLVEISKSDLQNENMANILLKIGQLNQYITNDCKKAVEYQERSLKMYQRIHKNADLPEIATLLNDIGDIYHSLEEYKKAIDFYERSLAMDQRIRNDADHPEIANLLNNIGVSCDNLREYKKAIDYYERSLAMRERIHKNADHSDIASSLNNIGLTYKSLEEYKKALDYFERSLAMRERIHKNADHPDIALSLYYIGVTCDLLEEYKKAIDYYARALRMYRLFFDSNHSRIQFIKKEFCQCPRMYENIRQFFNLFPRFEVN